MSDDGPDAKGQGLLARLRDRARALGREVAALSLATTDRRVPLVARALALVVVAYALSPIDLVPDFIPIIGLLDDLLLLPFGIALAVRLIPPPVMADLRRRAEGMSPRARRAALLAAGVIVAVWLVLAIGVMRSVW